MDHVKIVKKFGEIIALKVVEHNFFFRNISFVRSHLSELICLRLSCYHIYGKYSLFNDFKKKRIIENKNYE